MSGNAFALGAALLTVFVAELPQRDAGFGPPTGAAVISGRVMTDEVMPQPVRRAIVTIGGDAPAGRSAITDDDGRFTFPSLPAGQFTISARKAAYLSGAYGATRPGRPGTPLTVGAGQQAEVTVRVTRGAVVTGIVRDELGRPLASIPLAVVRVPGSSAIETLFNNAEHATSDDRGVYRVFGLAPGEYVVVALPRLPGSGEITGWTAGNMDSVLRYLELRSGRGTTTAARPGAANEGMPQVSSVRLCADLLPRQPGVRGRDSAATRVGRGARRHRLPRHCGACRHGQRRHHRRRRGARRGTDVDHHRRPAAAGADGLVSSIEPKARRRQRVHLHRRRTRSLHDHGAREPGQTAAPESPAAGRVGAGGGLSGTMPPGAASPAPGETLFAVAEVDVTATDVTGVTLALQPGATFSGRIAFDPAATQPRPDLTKTRVSLASPLGTGYTMTANTIIGNTFQAVPPMQIRSDGTFSAGGIAPGTYLIRSTLPADAAAAWWLSSAVVNGRDALDFPLEIALGRDVSNAVLTFSDRRTELTGALQTASGQPAPEHFVVAFPVDRAVLDGDVAPARLGASSDRWTFLHSRSSAWGVFRRRADRSRS